MKYALIIPDGCADEPQLALGDQTPLQAAHLPHMDKKSGKLMSLNLEAVK